jgi:proline-specific peptidase
MTPSDFLNIDGRRIWYRIDAGADKNATPLLTLHGGPGGAHHCLEPLARMSSTGRSVVFYDQLGCGQSDRPADPGLWTIDYFLHEIDQVRDQLDLEHIHLLGLSWGGMLAMEYAVRHPAGLRSVVIASAAASIPKWVEACNRLRRQLPEDVQATLAKHETAGTTDTDEYHIAAREFYNRHVCRRQPWPDYVLESVREMESSEVYQHMNGPSEFHVTGTLKDWSIEGSLSEINVPVLITSGRYDECVPDLVDEMRDRIPGARSVMFEESAHFAHAEEPERYLEVVMEFLDAVERAADDPQGSTE